ncbi:hypothetical protein Avbf_10318, partial [Armadillidium vulgare]
CLTGNELLNLMSGGGNPEKQMKVKMCSLLYVVILLTLSEVLCEVNDVNDNSGNAVSGARIFKCKCDINEALDNEGNCVNSQNPVQVWDYIKQQDLTVDISAFSSVAKNSVECIEGFTKLNLNRSHFVIYTNGMLDNLLLVDDSPTDYYCIEHILTSKGIDIIAEVCEKNPAIPICCPSGYETNADGECVYREDLPFSPPLIGNFHWNGYNTTQQNITCQTGEVLEKAIVTQPHFFGASLVSYPIGEQLQWQAIDGLPLYYSSKKYCLTISEQETNWLYYAHFCIPDKKLEHIQQCSNRTCLRKCCPYNHIYDEAFGSCVQYFDFQIKYKFTDSSGNEVPEPDDLTLMLGLPYCDVVQTILFNDSNTLRFLENGSLPTDRGTYSSLYYCVEGHSFDFQDPNNTIVNSAFICHTDVENPCTWRWIISSVLLSISCFFYILIFLVHTTIEDLRTKMVGKCLISEVVALLYLKLFLVMGISWLLEIVMWVAVKENDCGFSWVVDIVNIFQSVYIFFIFVCKKSTLDKKKEINKSSYITLSGIKYWSIGISKYQNDMASRWCWYPLHKPY